MSQFSCYRRKWATLLALSALIPMPGWAKLPGSDSDPARILVVGDSISAEYGIGRNTGWVALLGRQLTSRGTKAEILNASISGDTTSGGVSRLAVLLDKFRPDIVIIELGANDALRGLSMDMSLSNLTQMVQRSKSAGAKVILAGMQIPPNYGRDYVEAFKGVFTTVAKTEKVYLVPFLLEGVADQRSLFQADGLHPNESAQPIMTGNIMKVLAPLLKP